MSTPVVYCRDLPELPEDHEAAGIFPLMPDEELRQLVVSMDKGGLEEPIVLFQGTVLDGRNRLRALVELHADWRPHAEHIEDWESYDAETFDPVAFVVAKNLHRRHLSESQRAAVAARLSGLQRGGDRKSDKIKVPIGTLIIGQASEALNVSPRSVKRARKVQTKGIPELMQAVESGAVTVAAAAAVADLPPDEQEKLLEEGPDAIRAAARAAKPQKLKPPEAFGPESKATRSIVLGAELTTDELEDAMRSLVAVCKPMLVAQALYDVLGESSRKCVYTWWGNWLRGTTSPKDATEAPTNAVMEFPCKPGVKGSPTWTLTSEKLAEYVSSFPGLDVLQSLREARQWLLDKPARQKTYVGMPAFLGGWLTRNNDSGRHVDRGVHNRVNIDPRGNFATAKAVMEDIRNGHAPF